MAETTVTKQKKAKQKWVEAKVDHDGHKTGEVYRVLKSACKDLIAQAKVEETNNPIKKQLGKLKASIMQDLGAPISESVKKAIDESLKAIDEAKQKQHPISGVRGIKGLLGPNVEQAGTVVGGGYRFAKGEDGELIYDGKLLSSGCGMGDFLTKMADATQNPGKAQEIEAAITKAYSLGAKDLGGRMVTKTPLAEGSGITGGYLVPTEFLMRLLQLVTQQSIVRPRCTVIPMGARSIRIPVLDHTTAYGAGYSPFLAGMLMSWVEEAASRPETEPQFKDIELVAHELTGLTKASNTLLADSAVALDALLTTLFTRAIAFYTDFAYLQGTGSGKPLGVLNAPGTIAYNRAVPNTFKLADAAGMLANLLTTSMGSAVWVMSQTLIPQLVQLQDAAGRVVWIPNANSTGGAAQSLPVTLFGLPILFTEKVPPLGTKGDVMLCDFNYYLVGDRQQIQIDSSIHAYFANNQIAWRVISRQDGQQWLDGAITLQDNSTTVSPFIALN